MADFDIALNYVIAREGGLYESKNDPGGITNHGISLRFLKCLESEKRKQYGINPDELIADDVKNINIEQVQSLYFGEFWQHAHFDKINNQNNCNYIFDTAVNMGISPAIKCAQRACWSVLKDKNLPIEDGILGNETLAIINQCSIYLLPAMRSERAGEYRLIAERNPHEKEYLEGWLNRSYVGYDP